MTSNQKDSSLVRTPILTGSKKKPRRETGGASICLAYFGGQLRGSGGGPCSST